MTANTRSFPPAIRLLLLVNGIAFLLLIRPGSADGMMSALALWPPGASFRPWQLFSYAFLHASLGHLIFNMFALWMLGSEIENYWGTRRFLVFYFVCVLGAGCTQLAVAALSGTAYPTVGASGGVFGILLAYGTMFPNRRLILLFPPIPIKARHFVIAYGALELWLGITGTQAGVAHFAHLGGMLFGYLLIQYWRARWPFRRTRR